MHDYAFNSLSSITPWIETPLTHCTPFPIFRYYGLRKISSPAVAAVAKRESLTTKMDLPQVTVVPPMPPVHSMSRPIITVTEFTPSTSPDKVGYILVNLYLKRKSWC
jgi:hypothetical protein